MSERVSVCVYIWGCVCVRVCVLVGGTCFTYQCCTAVYATLGSLLVDGLHCRLHHDTSTIISPTSKVICRKRWKIASSYVTSTPSMIQELFLPSYRIKISQLSLFIMEHIFVHVGLMPFRLGERNTFPSSLRQSHFSFLHI